MKVIVYEECVVVVVLLLGRAKNYHNAKTHKHRTDFIRTHWCESAMNDVECVT